MQDSAGVVSPEISTALDRLATDLTALGGSNFCGLILFGGLARGRFRPGYSDVNVVLVLKEATSAALQVIAPSLRTAWRSAGVEPMILKESELALAAEAFPTKFLDIKKFHRLLAGVDPFDELVISRDHLRLRTEQELANLLLRVRRRYVAVAEEPMLLTRALVDAARPFALQLQNLLVLSGKPLPETDRTLALYEAAASAFDLPMEPLRRLAAIRQAPGAAADAQAVSDGLLEALTRAVAVAANLKDAPG